MRDDFNVQEETGSEAPDPKDLARESRDAIARIRGDLTSLSDHLRRGIGDTDETADAAQPQN